MQKNAGHKFIDERNIGEIMDQKRKQKKETKTMAYKEVRWHYDMTWTLSFP